jgi:hypothetical protein
MQIELEQKSPEDLMVPRVNEVVRNLAVSAAVVTVGVMTPTALAAVVPLAAIVVTPHVARVHVHHRSARRRTTGARHNHSRRERDRQPESEVQRPTRLRRGGEPSESNCGNQTEDIFCLHERFDEVFMRFFNGLKKWKVAGFESVNEKEDENE